MVTKSIRTHMHTYVLYISHISLLDLNVGGEIILDFDLEFKKLRSRCFHIVIHGSIEVSTTSIF